MGTTAFPSAGREAAVGPRGRLPCTGTALWDCSQKGEASLSLPGSGSSLSLAQRSPSERLSTFLPLTGQKIIQDYPSRHMEWCALL